MTGSTCAAVLARWLTVLCGLLLAACAPREPWRHDAQIAGTRVELLIHGGGEGAAQAAATAVLADFERLQRRYHAWQPSELTALNAALAAGEAAQVAPELAALLRQALALAATSEALFNPALGQWLALWGFHAERPRGELPRTAALDALVKRRPASADFRIDGTTVSSAKRAVAFDVGGFLNGVALDRAAAALRARGVGDALVNVGGNILALGSKGAAPWRVGIAHPRPESAGGKPLATLDLHDGEALCTSGDYQRFFEVGGKRYFPILDPRTGRPAWGTQALSVLMPPGADAGARADAWAKALFVAGDDWPALARRLGVTAVLRVAADGRVELTPALRARLTFETPERRLVVRE